MVAKLGVGRPTGTIKKAALAAALVGALALTGIGAGKVNLQDVAGDPSQWRANFTKIEVQGAAPAVGAWSWGESNSGSGAAPAPAQPAYAFAKVKQEYGG